VARRTHTFYSFNNGELDPKLWSRADVKHYHSSLARAKNTLGQPQGGQRLKFGTRHRAICRRIMVAQSFSGATVTAPNGGTASNLTDGNQATALQTDEITSGTFRVLKIDFGAPVSLAAFDLLGARCESGEQVANAIQVRTSADDVTYTNFGTAYPMSKNARNIRAALAPKQTRTARYWDVVIVNGESHGDFLLNEIEAFTAGDRSAGRLFEVNRDPDNIYALVATGGNVDVFEAGVWRAAIRIPHSSAQLAELTWTTSADSVYLFHKDVPVRRLLRLGAAAHWSSSEQTFTNIPRFDFGDVTYTNGVNEKQLLAFSLGATSLRYTLTIEGYTTEAIEFSDTLATHNTNIQTALEALPNVEAGLTVTTKYNAGSGNPTQHVLIEFTGGRNAARPWLELIPRILVTDVGSTVTASREQRGRKGGEDLWSATRGYPRCGVIFNERLVLAGFRGIGSALALSRPGELFDYDTEFEGPSGAILDLLGSDDDRTVRRLHVGRHLQVFTNTSAHYVSNRTIDKTEPRNYVQSARAGIAAGSRSIDLQGATVYIETDPEAPGGEVVREFLFSDVEQDYQATNLSILQSHLITGALDLAVKRSSSSSDSDIVFVVRADGHLSAMTALRTEDVNGITWWGNETGAYRSACVENRGLVHFLREVEIGEDDELVLETADQDIVLDGAVDGVVAGTTVSGLEALEGASVWAYLDGAPYGPFEVEDGEIELPVEGVEAALVGRWSPPELRTLPIRPQDSESAPVRPKRVHKVFASVLETGNIAIGANGGPVREVPVWRFDEVLDVPVEERLFTGEAVRDGMLGWTMQGEIFITQTKPARLELRGLRAEYDG